MRLKPWIQTALAGAAVAGLLFGTLLACNGVLHMQDNHLLAATHQRARQPDEISIEAEELPLVQALWDLENFEDKTTLFHETGADADKISTVTKPTVADLMQALCNEKAIPKAILTYQLSALETAQEAGTRIDTATPFSLLYGGTYNLQLYEKSTVTGANFWVQGSPDTRMDLADCAKAYAAYLGVDGLGDWQSAPTPDIAGQQAAALYSESAQLYLMALVDTRGPEGYSFTLGVYPMTYEGVQQRAKANG